MARQGIGKKAASHIVAKVSGVTEHDTKIEAARKAVATMKLAGFSTRAINKAEQMIEDAIARGVT